MTWRESNRSLEKQRYTNFGGLIIILKKALKTMEMSFQKPLWIFWSSIVLRHYYLPMENTFERQVIWIWPWNGWKV